LETHVGGAALINVTITCGSPECSCKLTNAGWTRAVPVTRFPMRGSAIRHRLNQWKGGSSCASGQSEALIQQTAYSLVRDSAHSVFLLHEGFSMQFDGSASSCGRCTRFRRERLQHCVDTTWCAAADTLHAALQGNTIFLAKAIPTVYSLPVKSIG